MQISQKGIQLLELNEGVNKNSAGLHITYLDSGGAPTIGIGHLLTQSERSSGKIIINGQPIKYSFGLTEQQAQDLLTQDLVSKENGILSAVKVPLTQNEFDALVSFVFNVGLGAFQNSTMLKLINQSQYTQAGAQFPRWNIDNGRVVQGLVDRRSREQAMWEGRF